MGKKNKIKIKGSNNSTFQDVNANKLNFNRDDEKNTQTADKGNKPQSKLRKLVLLISSTTAFLAALFAILAYFNIVPG